MNVLVAGGTGYIGEQLCAELDMRGHDVTALARHPEFAELPEGIERVQGDVTAYDSMEGAFEGQDAVVNLVALSPLFKPSGGDKRHFDVHLRGTENVVDAAEEHGVERLVQMSALGADPDGPTAFIRAKGQAERVVRDSELEWVIIRPSVVFGEGGEFIEFTLKLTPPFVAPLPGGGKTRFQPIWLGDLVPILADAVGPRPTGYQNSESSGDAVEEEEHAGETYEIGGPETLTLAEVARLAHRAKGRSLTVVPVPMGLAGIGLKIAGKIPGFPMGADQYRSLKMDNTVEDNDVEAFGYEVDDLRTLEAYLDEEM